MKYILILIISSSSIYASRQNLVVDKIEFDSLETCLLASSDIFKHHSKTRSDDDGNQKFKFTYSCSKK